MRWEGEENGQERPGHGRHHKPVTRPQEHTTVPRSLTRSFIQVPHKITRIWYLMMRDECKRVANRWRTLRKWRMLCKERREKHTITYLVCQSNTAITKQPWPHFVSNWGCHLLTFHLAQIFWREPFTFECRSLCTRMKQKHFLIRQKWQGKTKILILF